MHGPFQATSVCDGQVRLVPSIGSVQVEYRQSVEVVPENEIGVKACDEFTVPDGLRHYPVREMKVDIVPGQRSHQGFFPLHQAENLLPCTTTVTLTYRKVRAYVDDTATRLQHATGFEKGMPHALLFYSSQRPGKKRQVETAILKR